MILYMHNKAMYVSLFYQKKVHIHAGDKDVNVAGYFAT